MVLTAASLSQFLPDSLNLTGGLGLAGILGVLFPYIEKLFVHLFNFNVTEYFGKFFGSNSVLGTSFGIVGIGALVALLQQLWNYGWNLYNEYFSISLEIPSSDSSYWEMLEWIHTRQMKNPKHLSLQTDSQQSATGKWETVHEFVPNVGTHNFKFEGKKFVIERRREDKATEAYSVNRLENIILSATGSDTTIFRDMLKAVKKYKEVKNQGKTLMYTASQGSWQGSGSGKRKRPLESVILDDGVSERVIDDIQDFLDSSEWYSQFGVPYRRGYLLYGPPGTGKTSFISALAGRFDLNVCVLNLSDKSLTDDSLNRLLIDAPESSVVLLEDVDAAFGTREEAKESTGAAESDGQKESSASHSTTAFEGMNRLTFSGLLNALDGVASSEGRILFMTTNYVDRLDPALVRPGRVDTRQYIGYASESQVERMFRRFHRHCTNEEATRFVEAVFDRPERPNISLAQLQGLFLQFKSNPADVFSGISMLYT